MRKFGLIGRSLKHSFSQDYFTKKFAELRIDASYSNCELDHLDSLGWMRDQRFEGCNVTMPYKAAVLDLVDEVDSVATEVGAINTIKREGSKLIGYNTDVIGFEQSLRETNLVDHLQKRALILGSGGAARAVAYVLNSLGFSYAIVSRNKGDLKYGDIDESVMSTIGLVVNATPLGMQERVNEFPNLPYQYFSERHLAVDLIYNPDKTVFLTKAERQKASILNGRRMLILQAEASWSIWNN